ncbi:MAG: hypothetical protein IKL36_04350 [Clostridia bacterium]|nr:hypothetical protein [Clostridia bacterium]
MFYRFSVDDNIRFLQDLTEGEYSSVFEHPYLKMYKDLHEKYGTKIQLNLFYTMNGFDLSMMTDKYKKEWQENSHWLRFSFHSRSDGPPFPYRDSDYDEVYRDCRDVHREVRRFAGEECLSYFITVHYCQASPEAIRALRDCGIRGIVGLFKEAECYGRKRDGASMTFEYDKELGMYLFCNDIILNLYPLSMVEGLLSRDDHKDFTEVMIHEQYYYPDYFAHVPDFEKIVEAAIRYLTEKGRKSIWLEELVEM